MDKILLLILTTFLLGSVSPAQSDFWEPTNGPYGGSSRVLAISQTGVVYSGTQCSGILRSTDHGQSWERINIGLTSYCIDAITIDSAGMLWSGTATGVFRSSDEGNSWIQAGLTDIVVRSIVVNHLGVVFVGTWESGMYKSSDNGLTWVSINTGLTGSDFRALYIHNGSVLFVGPTSGGIFRSTDDGDSWQRVGLSDQYVFVLHFVLSMSGDIVAGGGWGIYLSTDDGTTWSQVADPPIGAGGFIKALDTDSEGNVLAAGTGIFRSNDGGISWAILLPHENVDYMGGYALCYSRVSGIFFGTENMGILRSTDDGNTWEQTHFSNFAVNQLSANLQGDIFSSTPYGTFRSTDHGASWIRLSINAPVFVEENGNLLSRGTSEVLRSTDNGDTWVVVGGVYTLISSPIVSNATGVVITSSDYIGPGEGFPTGLVRSTDGGANWTLVWSEFRPPGMAVNSVGVFFIWEGDRLYRSANGLIWSDIADSLFGTIFDIEFDSFLGTVAATSNGIYRSTNDGDTWIEVGMTGKIIRWVEINPSGDIFIPVDSVIYRAARYDTSWVPLLSGLNQVLNKCGVASPDGYVYVGTYDKGVYRSSAQTTDIDSQFMNRPHAFWLGHNYPNPFNPTTTIEFSIPHQIHVSVRIFDVLGEEISVLIDQILTPGMHRAVWNASTRSSGVYYVRFEAEGFVETRPILLLR